MVNFNDAILMLDKLGITDVLLPFILIFTITFAVMEKVQILGESKKFHSVIALVLGMAVVIPHVTNSYPDPRYDIVNIINTSLPHVSVILVAVVCALILLGVFWLKFVVGEKSIIGIGLLLACFAVVVYIFGRAAGWFFAFPKWLDFLNEPDTQALIVIILVFALIVRYIMKDEDNDGEEKESWTDKLKRTLHDLTTEHEGETKK
jgi:magnesium-transporting ATPase (P-type)